MTSPQEDPVPEESMYLRFFRSPAFLAATVGIPFCIFKFLFGLLAFRVGTEHGNFLAPAGIVIIAWAGTDIAMNGARAVLDFRGRRDLIEFCSLAQIGRIIGASSLFLALDTFLSFSIICYTLWSGWIRLLLPFETELWNAATTLNLISLSLVLLATELWLLRKRRRTGDESPGK
jgi:hypothetical protein